MGAQAISCPMEMLSYNLSSVLVDTGTLDTRQNQDVHHLIWLSGTVREQISVRIALQEILASVM